MSEPLDDLIARLATTPPDVSLDNFEAAVDRGIGRWRADARIASALRPVCLASVALALAIGIAAGGLRVTATGDLARSPKLFGAVSRLAPSSLIEGGR